MSIKDRLLEAGQTIVANLVAFGALAAIVFFVYHVASWIYGV